MGGRTPPRSPPLSNTGAVLWSVGIAKNPKKSSKIGPDKIDSPGRARRGPERPAYRRAAVAKAETLMGRTSVRWPPFSSIKAVL